MAINHSLQVLTDLTKTITDVKDKHIFSIIGDLITVSHDVSASLPELKTLTSDEASQLGKAAYVFVKQLMDLFAKK